MKYVYTYYYYCSDHEHGAVNIYNSKNVFSSPITLQVAISPGNHTKEVLEAFPLATIVSLPPRH